MPARLTAGARLERAAYGVLGDGTPVDEFTLRNERGLAARIITYGATITGIDVPDRTGAATNVVLGYRDLAGYVGQNATYFGATIGRFANRIARGRLRVGGHEYGLAVNNGANALHGGIKGFDKAVWRAVAHSTQNERAVLELAHVSPDGDEGYPGTLDVRVAFALGDDDGLEIAYAATTDRETVLNLTNHTYFNLAGEASGDVLQQELTIEADRYTPVDATSIPTGDLASVAGTPFDFRSPRAIGECLRQGHEQLLYARGYDHNWVLNEDARSGMRRAVRGYDPGSGRSVEVLTTEPGVQVYSGNYLDGTEIGTGGTIYRQSAGWTAETQHFPDSPNRPEFPSTVLAAGATYRSTTVFRFSTGVTT